MTTDPRSQRARSARRASGDAYPECATERLRLRQPTRDDAPVWGAVLRAEAVARHSNWPEDLSDPVVLTLLDWMMGLHARRAGCAWMIETRVGSTVGAIRFNSIHPTWRTGEVGYEIAPTVWNQGYATEALRAVVAMGHARLALHRIDAWTLPGNPASDRVLCKAGFRFEGTARGKALIRGAFHDLRIFARLPGDPDQA